jgi:DNA-directed RNA polymerase subunit N
MIIPMRCFSCGRPVSQHWEDYSKRVNKGENPNKVLNELGIDSFCCRALFLGHVDLIDVASQFKKF